MKNNIFIHFFSHIKNLINEKTIYYPIMKAIDEKDDSTLLLLLNKHKNLNVNYMNSASLKFNQETLLYKAINQNNFNAVKMLITHGADVNLASVIHLTSNAETVKLLLASGANPNLKDYDGFSVFHSHFYNKDDEKEEIFKLFLDYHANPNAQDREGSTVLHYIFKSIKGNQEIKSLIPLLIEYGADLNLKNNKNELPVDGIKTNQFVSNHKELIEFIQAFDEKQKLEKNLKNNDTLPLKAKSHQKNKI